jgi:hypothetical protein
MEPACGQPAVEGRVDECSEVLGVEHLARDRDRRRAWDELGCRELALRVPTNGREDVLAILPEAAVARPVGIES